MITMTTDQLETALTNLQNDIMGGRTPSDDPLFASYGSKDFYTDDMDFEDEKTRTRFINDIEKIIRTSMEYRNFIRYLKTDRMMHYCTIFNKLPEEIMDDIKVEMHHFPITLYDMVDTLLTKHLNIGKDFTRLSIAHEIMLDHYSGMVGLVPLTVTAHQLSHSGLSILTKDSIIGNYNAWMQKNFEFMDVGVLRKIELIEQIDSTEVEKNLANYFELDKTLFLTLEEENKAIEEMTEEFAED